MFSMVRFKLMSSARGTISGVGVFSAFSDAVSDTPPVHDGVSFSAQPGIRYLVNGAMVDGKPKVWVEEESYESNRGDDLR